ncbi:MAG: hypothetical protein KDE46_30215, partial [Caldilineaceae bacterium]|nr:hypothetical protein [Caldilineaceae bacterium]
ATPTNTPVPPTATPTNTPTLPPAMIGDMVWHDLNGNGQRSDGEPPLQGVTVTLYSMVARDVNMVTGAATVTNTVVATAVTALDGRYAFTAVTPGAYRLAFMGSAALVPTACNQGADDTIDSDACQIGLTTVSESPAFTLTAHQQQQQWDAGFAQPVTVQSHVYIDQNRNNQPDAGEPPLPNVTVILLDSPASVRLRAQTTPKANAVFMHGVGPERARAVTNANGDYTFTQLAPGTYQLMIVPPAGFTMLSSDLLLLSPLAPGETVGAQAGLVALQPTNLQEEPEPTYRLYVPFIWLE